MTSEIDLRATQFYWLRSSLKQFRALSGFEPATWERKYYTFQPQSKLVSLFNNYALRLQVISFRTL